MNPTAELTLFEAFKRVPDPRKRRGIRHPLHALLTLAATAIVSGARSVSAIGEFGRHHRKLAASMGFTRKKLPCQGTFHYLFKTLNIEKFEEALRVWALSFQAAGAGRRTIHIDGKSLHGSARSAIDCVHLLSAYCEETQAVVAQLKVDIKCCEPKVALELLRLIPMKGTVVTGDAIFTQRALSQQIIEDGGDYFWTVKDNQKSLRSEIENAFEGEALPPREICAQNESAHGGDDRQGAWPLGDAAH